MSLSQLRHRRGSEGFTLIELLIVVVIIGILAAIAIPQFTSTKESAYDAAAKSDLRNLMSAEEAYFATAQSYGGVSVSGAGGTATVGTSGPEVNLSTGITAGGAVSGVGYEITTAHEQSANTWCVDTDTASTSQGEIIQGTSC